MFDVNSGAKSDETVELDPENDIKTASDCIKFNHFMVDWNFRE